MPTTSLKLPDKLKQRAITAAKKQGMTPHAFMIAAIEQAADAVLILSVRHQREAGYYSED